MAKNRIPPFRRSIDSYRDNRDFEANPDEPLGRNRANNIRRDTDQIKNLSITLYDIDNAMKAYIVDVIKPTVETAEGLINVPVFFASGEKWVSIQEMGFMRDEKGKILVPAIAIKRSSINSSEIKFPKIATINNLSTTISSNYSRNNPYDKFSLLTGSKPKKDYYQTPVPEFIELQYDINIWADFQVQINYLVEQFIWFGGNFFGDKNLFKFYSDFDSTTIEVTNVPNEDRVVKASFSMKTKAYILPPEAARQVDFQRTVSVGKVVFGQETEFYEGYESDDQDPFGGNGTSNGSNAGYTHPKSPGTYPHENSEDISSNNPNP